MCSLYIGLFDSGDDLRNTASLMDGSRHRSNHIETFGKAICSMEKKKCFPI